MTFTCEAKNDIATKQIYVDVKMRREFVKRDDFVQKEAALLLSASNFVEIEKAVTKSIEPLEKTISISPISMEINLLIEEFRRLRSDIEVLVEVLMKPSKRSRPAATVPQAANLMTNELEGKKLLDLQSVEQLSGFKRSTIYARVAEKTFPPPVKLSSKASRWIASEVEAWLDARTAERNSQERVSDASASQVIKATADVAHGSVKFSNGN